MDYFQGVVAEYLRADRSMFVNPEILLQLDEGVGPKKGRFWYCDLMAVSFRERSVYLCEVTYSTSASALIKRLGSWRTHWPELKTAICRDCNIASDWPILPWVFLPETHKAVYDRKLLALGLSKHSGMPAPRFTALEGVVPWKYRTWDRVSEAHKSHSP
ncbi:MAG: hypothetical protein EAZ30_01865 [Betaproteobacteria bacterium]|nr:MAG: hypothetical protein EAZ30_01865 [Betaproteobacteria bacterium]